MNLGEQLAFEFKIFFREVNAVLRFKAYAVWFIGDSEYWRRLNSFGDAHTFELLPPTLQISNEFLRGREIFFDETRLATDILFDLA